MVADEGAQAFERADMIRALFYYGVAREVAIKLGDQSLEALALFSTGRMHINRSDNDAAMSAYVRAAELLTAAKSYDRLIYVLADLGALHLYRLEYEKAKEFSLKSLMYDEQFSGKGELASSSIEGQAEALTNLGVIYKLEGDYVRSLDYLQRALTTYRELRQKDVTFDYSIMSVQAEIGRAYRVSGDHSKALSHFEEAARIGRALAPKSLLAGVLNSVGLLYSEQRDYDKAVANFKQSLEMYAPDEDARQVTYVLLNLGIAEQRRGNYDSALGFLRQSFDKSKSLVFRDGLIAAGAGIGSTLRLQGKYADSLRWLEDSFSAAEVAKDATRKAEVLWQMAETHLAAKNYTDSIVAAQKALSIAELNRLPNLIYLSGAVLGKAYSGQKDFPRAAEVLSKAIDQIEKSRDYIAGLEQERLLFFHDKVAAYHTMVEVLLAQNRLPEALAYAERAKGRVLLDVIRDGRANSMKAMTTAEKDEARLINRTISELSERIASEHARRNADQAQLDKLYVQLDAARLKHESLQNSISAARPDSALRLTRSAVLTPSDLNSFSREAARAYIEYVVTYERVYLFVLTKSRSEAGFELKTYTVGVKSEELASKIERFRRMMANRNPAFAEAARELFDLLIQPAAEQLAGVRTLCIVPDGVLWDVPYQALLSSRDRYLIEDYALHYAPSMSVLREMRSRAKSNVARGGAALLAFGNPVVGFPSQSSITSTESRSLPEAETEVAALASIYGSTQIKALIRQDATEKSFKQLAPSHRVLHLATHGVLDNRNALYSRLLLTKIESDTENDGALEAREIMDMNLRADLAVLSACETARGKVGAGEGVIGMSWAFFIAGVRTTVVSQWKVNSAGTSRLMVEFHRALRSHDSETASKADALQKAATALMRDERYRHPFYWAGFMVIGSDQ